MIQSQHTRKPGFNERYYICRGSGKFYSNFNITVKYDKTITKSHLSHALRSLILKNSWFVQNFFKIEGTDSEKENFHNWRVQVLDRVLFEDVVKYEKIDKFDETTLERLNGLTLDMDVQMPLWRLVVFEEKHGEQLMTVYVDHSQFDGLSAVQFQKDLSKELARVADNGEVENVLFDYVADFKHLPSSLIPASEIVTDLYFPNYGRILNYYFEQYLPFYSKLSNWIYSNEKELPLFQNPKPVTKDLDTKYKIMKFDAKTVDRITTFCRSKGVTLTGYFDIYFIKALQETIFKAIDPNTAFRTNSYVAINGRRYYNDDIKDFRYGTMVCGNPIILRPIDNAVTAMRTFHAQLQQDIKSKYGFRTIGMLQYANLVKFFNNKIGKVGGGRPTVTISNLGKIADSNKVYRFKDMYFGANAGVMYNFVLNMTTVSSSEVTAVIGYLPEYEACTFNGINAIDEFFKLFKYYIENGAK
ncbi:hypothetical protein KGF57_002665 [Candida theae]|uniref:Uncharacterized protein n=1 Tax=Candida theae TaxID=1198502 RepID=A0AAD5BF19_9ASCO|nr:uncharacterized protein KGF57_002665 [Candida theae]KAI5958310.1 hypothetical protein KGF57_002665 [Candida theae]